MAQRKLQQDIDKTFKKVSEGIQAFEAIFDKIQQTTNASQKEKLEDNLKREIKKLQRHRDQIKTWAAGNEIKDKKPLMEQRKLIENEMEKFKAVEKEMKTKAFSKTGLSAAAKLDPKEREKLDACQFLSDMVDSLERQIETLEAEEEALHATAKKGKKDTGKADRLSEITRLTERHKWHQGKLELLLRALENGNVETEQVNDLKESIQYYVEENQTVEFMEDDTIYDDLNLEQDEGAWGLNNDGDRLSSQDAQSVADDLPETADGRGSNPPPGKSKAASVSDPQTSIARRPSNQLKSPLPALATLHTSLPTTTNGITNTSMKPAPLPTRPPGETLKYASAAAAAAASDRNVLGIAPLPPPPGAQPPITGNSGLSPPISTVIPKSSATPSPSATPALPASIESAPVHRSTATTAPITDVMSSAQASTKSPALSHVSTAASASVPSSIPPTPALEKAENAPAPVSASKVSPPRPAVREEKEPSPEPEQPKTPSHPPSENIAIRTQEEPEDESIYHLPPGLQDLIQSFEVTKSKATSTHSQSTQRLLSASHATCPDAFDAEKPRHYTPQIKYNSPRFYPQEPSVIIDDPNLYGRIDTDTLFYIFYYRQGTYQQYLAAKSLKTQSWRFHKQYQTWFQRHEEPKNITEEYEQGTYRFFDYESTWMNRRKADFKFAYKFLEDDL
ncbi:general negative regulator of transcription subunit 5 [Ptychographa xylographoides]|nr:general negative regulator of transcription subunit 5 [Ptychographa xylographoides]